MPASNFPGGFPNGLSIRGVPLIQAQPGQAFWVGNSSSFTPDCVGGANGNPGTYTKPFATLQRGLDMCRANTGDLVLIKPGHAETIADATTLTLNKAGVAIIGFGGAGIAPTFTFTAAAANIPVTASGITIQNCAFSAGFLDVASVFTVTGTNLAQGFTIEGCTFADQSSVLNFLAHITGNATAASLNGLAYLYNGISSLGITALTTAIKVLSATAGLRVIGNKGVFAVLNDTACLVEAGANQLTSFLLGDNIISKPNTSSTGGSFIGGSGNAWTGMAYNNYFYQVDASAGIWIATGHGTAFGYQNNYSPITGAADKSGLINPAAV